MKSTRRGFLRKLGLGAAALGLQACREAVYPAVELAEDLFVDEHRGRSLRARGDYDEDALVDRLQDFDDLRYDINVMRFVNELHRSAYDVELPEISVFYTREVKDDNASGQYQKGMFRPEEIRIALARPVESILTLFHEIGHAKYGSSEVKAEFMQLRLAAEMPMQTPSLDRKSGHRLVLQAFRDFHSSVYEAMFHRPDEYACGDVAGLLAMIKNDGDLAAAQEDINQGRVRGTHARRFFQLNSMNPDERIRTREFSDGAYYGDYRSRADIFANVLVSMAKAAYLERNRDFMEHGDSVRRYSLSKFESDIDDQMKLPVGFTVPLAYQDYLNDSRVDSL